MPSPPLPPPSSSVPTSTQPQQSHSAFFYGTLMAPSVLQRVTSSCQPKSRVGQAPQARKLELKFHPAILPHHKRRRVAGADYPAITPCPPTPDAVPYERRTSDTTPSTKSNTNPITEPKSSTVTSTSDTANPNSTTNPPAHPPAPAEVLGTLVHNLTDTDIAKLDLFEGDEYERRGVRVWLVSGTGEGSGVGVGVAGAGAGAVGGDDESASKGTAEGHKTEETWIDTQTYIWVAPESELEDGEWDFEQFRREKLHLWAGVEAVDSGMVEADAFEGGGSGGVGGGGGGMVNGGKDGTRGRGVANGEFERAWEDRQREGEEVVRSAV